ncbi:hypothetical protein Rhopal_006536-T1 [Rhodotorula paludigena]|uniref:RBR-type E3 ubiquitin transferase n=1 Tax=Rhodotorula paludigena TaxID=86838 RepID=A0AAV5GU60_9BASI|nr:hypothetical protein Rhopal_006536-T1 [Rhodotorula paludigena]
MDFIEEFETETSELMLAFRDFVERTSQTKIEAKQKARETGFARRADIKQRVLSLDIGFVDDEYDSQQFLPAPQWVDLEPKILKLIQPHRVERLLVARQQSLRKRYDGLKQALSKSSRLLMPLFVDFLALPSVKELWLPDTVTEVTDAAWEASLADVSEELAQYRLDLVVHARDLIQQIAGRDTPEEPDDVLLGCTIDLDDALFTALPHFLVCTFSSKLCAPQDSRTELSVGTLSDVLYHLHDVHDTPKLSASKEVPASPQFRFSSSKAVQAAMHKVLELAKLDPETASKQDILSFARTHHLKYSVEGWYGSTYTFAKRLSCLNLTRPMSLQASRKRTRSSTDRGESSFSRSSGPSLAFFRLENRVEIPPYPSFSERLSGTDTWTQTSSTRGTPFSPRDPSPATSSACAPHTAASRRSSSSTSRKSIAKSFSPDSEVDELEPVPAAPLRPRSSSAPSPHPSARVKRDLQVAQARAVRSAVQQGRLDPNSYTDGQLWSVKQEATRAFLDEHPGALSGSDSGTKRRRRGKGAPRVGTGQVGRAVKTRRLGSRASAGGSDGEQDEEVKVQTDELMALEAIYPDAVSWKLLPDGAGVELKVVLPVHLDGAKEVEVWDWVDAASAAPPVTDGELERKLENLHVAEAAGSTTKQEPEVAEAVQEGQMLLFPPHEYRRQLALLRPTLSHSNRDRQPPVKAWTAAHRLDDDLNLKPQARRLAIEYLPTLHLSLRLPKDYPDTAGPLDIRLSEDTGWLDEERRSKAESALGETYAGEECLFGLVDLVSSTSPDFASTLALSFPLVIRQIRPGPPLSSILAAFNSSSTSSTFATSSHVCPLCFSTRRGDACIRLSSCGCVFCVACLTDYFSLLITEGLVRSVACPSTSCVEKRAKWEKEVGPREELEREGERPGRLERDEIERLVGAEKRERWEWLKEKVRVESDPSITFCPRDSCQAAVPKLSEEDDKLRVCPTCDYSFCVYCRRGFHGNRNACALPQSSAIVSAYLDGDDEQKRTLELRYGASNIKRLVAAYEEERALREWLDANATECPGCSCYVNKSSGCNHMTCSKCNCHFCYRCGKSISPTDPYKHFNTPGGRCYGKLFDFAPGGEPGPEEWLGALLDEDH